MAGFARTLAMSGLMLFAAVGLSACGMIGDEAEPEPMAAAPAVEPELAIIVRDTEAAALRAAEAAERAEAAALEAERAATQVQEAFRLSQQK